MRTSYLTPLHCVATPAGGTLCGGKGRGHIAPVTDGIFPLIEYQV